MHLPALKNSVPASLNGTSIEDYIRNATRNLQNVAASMPGGGGGTPGTVYLGFNGNTGNYTLNKQPVDPKSLGRLLVPEHGLFEGMIEWANGSPLQKIQRPLRGIAYDEPMSERLLKKPLSPGAYRDDNEGPRYTMGFVGLFFDDGATVSFEGNSVGITKAINTLSTTAVQAVAAFGEIVHTVIELGSGSYERANKPVYYPVFNVVGYVTDKRAREVETLSDNDIVTRPAASRAKVARKAKEGPAI
jgi:hypothetical protein